MTCLLRNLRIHYGHCRCGHCRLPTPVNGWDRLPSPNDKSDSACLACIKFYRNELAHLQDSVINDADFKDQWKAVVEVRLHEMIVKN